MRKNDAFAAKIAKTRLTKIFVAIFAFAERLPTSASLLPVKILISSEHDFQFSLDDDILASLALSFSRYLCSEGLHSIVNRF